MGVKFTISILGSRTIYRWYKDFERGSKSVVHRKRAGPPLTAVNTAFKFEKGNSVCIPSSDRFKEAKQVSIYRQTLDMLNVFFRTTSLMTAIKK